MTAIPFLYPLEPQDMQECSHRAAKRLAELVKPNEEQMVGEVPGVKRLKGRELLAWYEETTDDYWVMFAAKFPDLARKALIEWGNLVRKYYWGVE